MENKIRTGLRIRGKACNSEVQESVKKFAAWVRKEKDFPIRLPVYLSPKEKVKALDGDMCYSIFFAPYDRQVEPYIRVATGDFRKKKSEIGRKRALFALLYDITKQLIRYFQWCNNGADDVKNVSRKAKKLMQKYVDDVVVP